MLYKRGRIWWYRFKRTLRDENGEAKQFLIQKSSGVRRKSEALELEGRHSEAIRKKDVHPLDPWPKPVPRPQVKENFREFSQRFLDHVSACRKPGTLTFYNTCLKRVLIFSPISNAPLSEVNAELVSKYVKWRKDQGDGNATITINGELRTIRRLLKLAHDWGALAASPKIHELAGEELRSRIVSFKEEAMYLQHASPILRDIAIVEADSGLRPNSELFPLQWMNVSLEPTADDPNGFIHIPAGKTDNAVRNIPLTTRSRSILLARKLQQAGSSRFVFPGKGKSGHIVTVQHAHEKAISKAEIEPFEFYCWRHTFATRCVQSRMDKFSLARLMGHSSPTITERYYIRVTPQYVTAGFEKFAAYQEKEAIEVFPAPSKQVQ